MLIVVVGTPSPIASWTLHVVRVAMQVFIGEHRLLTSQSLEAFRSDRRSSSADCTILYTTAPSRRLAKLLVRSKAPIIVATDDPKDVVSFLVAAKGLSLQTAVREYMKSAAALGAIASSPSIVRLSSPAYEMPLRAFLAKIVSKCRLEIGLQLLEGTIAALIGDHPKKDAVSVGDLLYRDVPGAEHPGTYSALDVRSQAVVEGISRQYEAMITGSNYAHVECPLALYITEDGIYETDNPWLSMVGSARCILWGPYIHLPSGGWLANLTVAVRENLSGNVLQIQILRELSECITAVAKLEAVGTFECQLEFEIDDPLERLEVTFTLNEGAIEGDFCVLDLTFSKAPCRR